LLAAMASLEPISNEMDQSSQFANLFHNICPLHCAVVMEKQVCTFIFFPTMKSSERQTCAGFVVFFIVQRKMVSVLCSHYGAQFICVCLH